ncbi:hypothetical protein [Cypionkella psychrotolerans]|uniref:hypothetical protein n=1 Tax=Cypionkella psychrotolerans TaxID=1678131 RepID=UPI0012E2911E|nr:hypothetical protein [Cypionkella psychrotolerans]
MTPFVAFAGDEGFLHFEFDTQALDLPPKAIASATVIKDFNNQDALDVTVTPEWVEALAIFTQSPQGRVISIFICGNLVAEPRLQGQISKGRFFLTGDPHVIRKAAVFLTAKSCTTMPNS